MVLSGTKTNLPGNALHHHSGHRRDGSPLRIIERALWVIKTRQGTDLVLGYVGLVGRLKEEKLRDETTKLWWLVEKKNSQSYSKLHKGQASKSESSCGVL